MVQNLIAAGHGVSINHAKDCSLVTKGRNVCTAEFLASKSSHLFWLDADMACDPDAPLKLLAHNKDVIGAAYLLRNGSRMSTMGVAATDTPGLYEADLLGTGCMLIHRPAFELMASTYPQLKLRDEPHFGDRDAGNHYWAFWQAEQYGPDYVGEDYNFCQRYRQAGGQIWLDSTIRTWHYGLKGHVRSMDEQLYLSTIAQDMVKRGASKEAYELLQTSGLSQDAIKDALYFHYLSTTGQDTSA